ncbi:Ribonuclease H-like superfamily [Sesbania bispinosa]|nr:Ribonuclease H-like superfamily [Sesbania bispinosa]
MWKADTLSFAGRLTLAQTVIAALPSYTMQSMLLPKGVCLRVERYCRDFIWGDKPHKKSWHFVPWEEFTLPKSKGGWGFQNLHSFNKAMIMKLSWGLVNKPSALWVRVLRSKYRCGSNYIPRIASRANASNAWRRIVATWDIFSQGMRWNIGNGESVSVWHDRWLHSNVVIGDTIVGDIPSHVCSLSVSNLVATGGMWDLSAIDHIIPTNIKAEILSYPLPEESLGSDKMCWRLTSNGMFSTHSAYELVEDNADVETRNNLWRILWKLDVPYETDLHLLRDYVFAKDACVEQNPTVQGGILVLYEFMGLPPLLSPPKMTPALVGWRPPPLGWCKLNTDGSVQNNGCHAGCGGVLRDHHGRWLVGFSHNIGSSLVLMAELRGIILGHIVAWDVGARKVILESDSQVAVKLVTDGVPNTHPYYFIVHRISLLLQCDWEVHIHHIWRGK